MRKSLWILALVPALALAQGNTGAKDKAGADSTARGPGYGPGYGPGRGYGPGAALDNPEQLQRIEKRVRLAATLGLSEALDLDEKGAMRVRDIFAKDIEKRAVTMKQNRDNVRVLRDAARGDKAAAAKVDEALAKLREGRAQMQKLDDETLQQITSGLTPEKKAKAAIFLARFKERGRHIAMGGGHWGRGGGMGGPGMMGPGRGGRGGPGFGPGPRGPGGPGGPRVPDGNPTGRGPGQMMDRQAFNQSGIDEPPDLAEWYGEED